MASLRYNFFIFSGYYEVEKLSFPPSSSPEKSFLIGADMEVRLILKDQAGKAAKNKCGEGIDHWGSAQKKDPGTKKPEQNPQRIEGSSSMGHICCSSQQHSGIL